MTLKILALGGDAMTDAVIEQLRALKHRDTRSFFNLNSYPPTSYEPAT
jgi:hypothetical protein